MAPSPLLQSLGVLTFQVLCDGKPMPDTAGVISMEVHEALGVIPSATLEIADGDMPESRWDVADGDYFKPGAAITVSVGYESINQTIFEGIVVRLSARINENNDSRLVVECRDKALGMTVQRRHEVHLAATDSDVLKKLIGSHGLGSDVEATTFQHEALVQYHATDWDFLMTRAEANGLLVTVRSGKVVVKQPSAAAPSLKVTWGQDLISFDADLDAQSQLSSVTTSAWDPKSQALVEATWDESASLPPQGNLAGASLAKVLGKGTIAMRTAAPKDQATLKDWGRAQMLKSGLARLRGSMRFQGHALARAGALVEVAGVGKRFEGTVLVSAVTHRVERGNWISEVEFGRPDGWFSRRQDVSGPLAGGLLPAAAGLQVGKVTQLDQDPMGQHRVQLSLPALGADPPKRVWARLMQAHASTGFGAFFLPEVDDEVVVAFFDGDPGAPVVLGSLYSSTRQPPFELSATNDTKAIVTRCRHKLTFDEKDKIITLTTPGANKVVLNDKDKSIQVLDQNGNKVELDPSGIRLTTPKDLKISAQGSVSIDAVGSISLTSQADVKSSGMNVSCQAQVGFVGKGSATAELSAAGQTTVKGALVMIN